jgi:hypothetical protein
VIDDGTAAAARAVAEELVPRYGPRLVADVEARIHAGDAQQAEQSTKPDQYVDPVALGALIVAVAQLGYQIYSDHKKKGQRPTCEMIARAIRIERRKHSDLTGDEAEVIDIVSAKIIENGDGELPEDAINPESAPGQLLSSIRGVGGSGLVSGSLGDSPGPLLLPGNANPVGPRWRPGVLRPATRPSAAGGRAGPGRASRR